MNNVFEDFLTRLKKSGFTNAYGYFVANILDIDVYNDLIFLEKFFNECDNEEKDCMYNNLCKIYDREYGLLNNPSEKSKLKNKLVEVRNRNTLLSKNSDNTASETLKLVGKNMEVLNEEVKNFEERIKKTSRVNTLSIMLNKLDSIMMSSNSISIALYEEKEKKLLKGIEEKEKKHISILIKTCSVSIAIILALAYFTLNIVVDIGVNDTLSVLKNLIAIIGIVASIIAFISEKVTKLFFKK